VLSNIRNLIIHDLNFRRPDDETFLKQNPNNMILYFLLILQLCLDSHANHFYQRCFGDILVAESIRDDMVKSTCGQCQKSISSDHISNVQPHAHLLFVIEPWSSLRVSQSEVMHPLIILASNMFRRGFDVTILQLTDPACKLDNEYFTKYFFSTLACSEPVSSKNTLRSRTKDIGNLSLCDPLISIQQQIESPFDGLELVEPMILPLQREIESLKYQPHTIIAQSSLVASTLVAEKLNIPLIMLAEPVEMNLIAERLPQWQGIYQFFVTRIQSITNGIGLAKFNKVSRIILSWKIRNFDFSFEVFLIDFQIRKSLDLLPLSMPSDYYKAADWVILHSVLTTSRRFPSHVQTVRPLFTECIPCQPKLESSRILTVLVAPLDIDSKRMRAIIRGIILAKMSLQTVADMYCDEEQPGINCESYKVYSQIRAVVISPIHGSSNIPKMMPPYILVDKSHPADIMARHPFVFVMISHCDATAHLSAAVKLDQICIRRKGLKFRAFNGRSFVPYHRADPQDIAQALLKLFLQPRPFHNFTLSSMNTAPELVAKVAYLKKSQNFSNITKSSIRYHLGQNTEPNEDLIRKEFANDFLSFASALLLLTLLIYSNVFLSVVKHEDQISIWRRRYRWIARYTNDMDPAIFDFSKWLVDPNALHNQWEMLFFDSRSSPKDDVEPKAESIHTSQRKKRGPRRR
jgi:hypothetical protein